MSSEPPNPYESPIIPAEEPLSAVRGVIATFVFDEAAQWESVKQFRVPWPDGFNYWAMVAGAGLFILPLVLPRLVSAVLLFSGVGVLVAFSIWQDRRNRQLQRYALESLRQHPILGATGIWRLTVDREKFLVETPGGQQIHPRENNTMSALEGKDLVFWFDNFPIVIPENDAAQVATANGLRDWLWKTASRATP